MPLARGTLITHCYKDLSFMDFICTMVTKAVQVSMDMSLQHVNTMQFVFSLCLSMCHGFKTVLTFSWKSQVIRFDASNHWNHRYFI